MGDPDLKFNRYIRYFYICLLCLVSILVVYTIKDHLKKNVTILVDFEKQFNRLQWYNTTPNFEILKETFECIIH